MYNKLCNDSLSIKRSKLTYGDMRTAMENLHIRLKKAMTKIAFELGSM